jgi:CheY-like chemotaxis protein
MSQPSPTSEEGKEIAEEIAPQRARDEAAWLDGMGRPIALALRILVVEDHRDTLRTLLRFLEHLGHEARGAATVGEARQLAEEWAFDTLLCDIGLGDEDGWTFARELRREKEFCGIAMSGLGGPEDLKRSATAGFELHLVKPFDPAGLERVLKEVGLRRLVAG